MKTPEEADKNAYQRKLLQQSRREEKLNGIVRDAVTAVTLKVAGTKPPLFPEQPYLFFGATGIDPKYLSICFLFRTDAALTEANHNGLTQWMTDLTHEELRFHGYPAAVVQEVGILFVSDETVQREAEGNYFDYFK